MTKILQFMGGFILSFLLIIGLLTGIYWFTREYTPPPPPPVDIDSLAAIGAWPDSISVYESERYHLREQQKQIIAREDSVTYREQVVAQREALAMQLQQQMGKASAEEDSIRNRRYNDLAQLVENMKPSDGAELLNSLPELSAAKILMKMRKRQAGRVLNAMTVDPARVAQISQLMTLLRE